MQCCRILHKSLAAFGDLLFGLAGMFETARTSDCDSPSETVRKFDLVALFLDRLPRFDIVYIAQDEQGPDELAEGLHRLVEVVLPGVRVQSPEDFRSGGFLELDRCDQVQQVIPGRTDRALVDVFGGRDHPSGCSFSATATAEMVEVLFLRVLEPRCIGQSE